jgi:hypothetical protein
MKIEDFQRTLQEYPIKQIPKAGQFIVNQMAFEARQLAVKNVDRKFILRNRFVTGRIQFEMARFSTNLREIQSHMGALESIDFMAKQEKGFVIKPTDGNKVAIPTRGVRISKSIEKRKRTIYRARKRDKTPALIPYADKPGIYIIRNIRKRASGTFSFKPRMLYDLSRKQVVIKPKKHPQIVQTAWNRFLSRL